MTNFGSALRIKNKLLTKPCCWRLLPSKTANVINGKARINLLFQHYVHPLSRWIQMLHRMTEMKWMQDSKASRQRFYSVHALAIGNYLPSRLHCQLLHVLLEFPQIISLWENGFNPRLKIQRLEGLLHCALEGLFTDIYISIFLFFSCMSIVFCFLSLNIPPRL